MSAELLYPLIGGSLSALGAALLLWSLFRDRARGRLRCPKCWYRMEGVPETESAGQRIRTCPECGRACAGERQLRRTRRRKRWAAVALLLLISGWGVWKFPQARARGLWSYAPTTVLIAVHRIAYEYGWGGSEIGAVLLERTQRGELASWQLQAFAPLGYEAIVGPNWDRVLPAGLAFHAQLSSEWWMNSIDGPRRFLLVKARLPNARAFGQPVDWSSSDNPTRVWDPAAASWIDLEPGILVRTFSSRFSEWGGNFGFNAGISPAGADEIVFDWRVITIPDASSDPTTARVLMSGERRLPVTVAPPGSDQVRCRPLRSATVDELVRAGLVRGLEKRFSDETLGLRLDRPEGEAIADLEICATIELMNGETPVSRIIVLLRPDDSVPAEIDAVSFSPPVSELPAHPDDPRLALRIRSYPEGIVDLFKPRPHYWDGDITIPLSEILAREPRP